MGDIYTNPPQSRNEAILRATIDGTEYTDPPQSRIEDLLLELKEAIEEGGGGGGTTVVPNPEGEATGDLNKVQIGSTIFGVLGELGTAAKKDSTNAVTEDSSDLVESGAVYSALDSKQPKTLNTPIIIGGVSRTTVEAALGALEDNKEDTILAATPLVKEYDEVMRQEVLRLTMDDTPTASSNNPVKSGGVKSAITATVDLMKDTTGWIGKNEVDVTKYNHISTNCVASGSGDVMTFTAPTAATGNYAELSYYESQTSDVLFDHNKARKMMIIVTALTSNKAAIGVRNSESRFIKTLKFESTGTYVLDLSDVAEDYYVGVYPRWEYNNAEASMTYKLMVYDARLDDTYQPYHGTVEDVKADKSSVISALDDTVGWVGKNKAKITLEEVKSKNTTGTWNGNDYTLNGVTFTFDPVNKTVTAKNTATDRADFSFWVNSPNRIPAGKSKITGCPEGGSASSYRLSVWNQTLQQSASEYGNGLDYELADASNLTSFTISIASGTNMGTNGKTFLPMITTPEEYKLSPAYEPYHESVEEIINALMAFTEIPNNSSLNDIKAEGSYYCANATNAGTITDKPNTNINAGFRLDVIKLNATNAIIQTLQYNTQPSLFCKRYADYQGTFGSWYKYEGTIIS